MNKKSSRFKVISAMFLVAGTSIGGGMLALPVASGIYGFTPSILLMIVSSILMGTTGLIYAELALSTPGTPHVISMAETYLGKYGKIICWPIFLFMSYASIVAYAAGGGITVINFVQKYLSLTLTKTEGVALFILIFATLSTLGSKLIGKINAFLVISMILSYFTITFGGLGEIKSSLLAHTSWAGSYHAIPLLLTSFSFQAFIVPSLKGYLDHSPKRMKWAIIGGVAGTITVYGLWQLLVLGTVPVEGEKSLMMAFTKGEPATEYLKYYLSNPSISLVSEYFAFFALTTSFLGMGLGLFDFLADGFRLKKKGKDYFILLSLILLPTIFFSTAFERIFIIAMDTTGGYGDTLLNGLIPIIMVLILRNRHQKDPLFIKSKFFLYLIFLMFLAVFILEFLIQAFNF